MSAAYSVTLTDADGTPHDLTADVIRATWRIGMREAFALMADDSQAEITVRARTPAALESLLKTGARIKITCTRDELTRTLYTGTLRRVTPQVGVYGARTATLEAFGLVDTLAHTRVSLPLLVNTSAPHLITVALNALNDASLVRLLDSSRHELAYAGDTWGESVTGAQVIRDAVEAERGRFFVNREGAAVFLNRQRIIGTASPSATLTDSFESLTLTHASGIREVAVNVTPRALGASNATLWTLNGALAIRAGTSELVVRFSSSGQRIGAAVVLSPVPSSDYTVNTQADGAGTNITAQVSVTLGETTATTARLLFNNASGTTAYLLSGARLRGTPLLRGDPLTARATESAEAGRIGDMSLSPALLDSVTDAEHIARYTLGLHTTPHTRLTHATLTPQASLAHGLALTLFDAMRLRETHSGHDAVYRIVGEAHTVTHGGTSHRITWTLEPLDTRAYWALGVSRLGSDTGLAY